MKKLVDIVIMPFVEKIDFVSIAKNIVVDEKRFILIVLCINISEKSIQNFLIVICYLVYYKTILSETILMLEVIFQKLKF